MSTATASDQTLDSIIDQLDRFHQRATYGAVAAIVDTSPRSLMTGRPRDARSSWVVSRQTRTPTGYKDDEIHPELTVRERVLNTPEELRAWLDNPT